VLISTACVGEVHPLTLPVLHLLQVLSGQICYDQHQQQHVAAVYGARAFLHAKVYQHPQAKAAELVIADALAAAEPVLRIADKVDE
jgi:HD superfamily phosphohydrolase